jgi:hypothetical protein
LGERGRGRLVGGNIARVIYLIVNIGRDIGRSPPLDLSACKHRQTFLSGNRSRLRQRGINNIASCIVTPLSETQTDRTRRCDVTV